MQPFFLPTRHGKLYGLHLPAQTPARAQLLWLPAFAEEANCCCRHIARAARECQQRGYDSLLLDLSGTGESDGELADADWTIWQENTLDAVAWLRARSAAPIWLVGVRAGALLAAALARGEQAASQLAGVVTWQPVSSGRAVLDGFLRLAMTAGWTNGNGGNGGEGASAVLSALRARLAAGETVEVAGYAMNAAMATALAREDFVQNFPSTLPVACMEFRSEAQHSPALLRLNESLQKAGVAVRSSVSIAAPFWQAHEAALTPGLGDALADLLSDVPERAA